MSDQQPNDQTTVDAEGVSNGVAAAAGCSGLESNPGNSGNSSETPAANHEATSSTAGVAKPRVFKMSDEFLMFKFKIEMCSRKDRHDWKICPYAHPGEVARRRHPRGYTAVLCPAKTAASCPRREQCTFAHNPFEFWLHPDRFKTSLCNQGRTCDRPICFFAHKDDELRRLANGLEAAGPDDYVYATAPTPDACAAPPPPPPPPRTNSLAHAGSGGLAFLQNSTMVAAAAAAAAAVASLNSSNSLLGASPHQLMMMGGEDALLQAAGGGLMPDTATALCNSSWVNSNSDPSLLTTAGLTAQARQLSGVTSPVPLPTNAAGSRALRNSLPSSGIMALSLDQAAALAATGLDACMLAGMQGMQLSHQLSGNSASLTNAVNMVSAGGMVGSAPAGYGLLQGSDISATPAAYQQQLVLQQLIQQQALAAVNANNAGLQQLLQQQQVQLQQLQLQQQLAAAQQQQQQAQPQAMMQQQQQLQQWQNSLLASDSLAASAPASQQLLWQQQQQLESSQFQAGSLDSSGTPPDGNLAAALAGAAVTRMPSVASSARMASTAPVANGMGQHQQQQQGMLKWSSSVLSKRTGSQSNQGTGDLLTQASLEQASSRGIAEQGTSVVGFLGGGGAAAAAGAVPMTSARTSANTLDQLSGLLQMVHVSSSAGMMGPGGM